MYSTSDYVTEHVMLANTFREQAEQDKPLPGYSSLGNSTSMTSCDSNIEEETKSQCSCGEIGPAFGKQVKERQNSSP
jgi:hypothetical protein